MSKIDVKLVKYVGYVFSQIYNCNVLGCFAEGNYKSCSRQPSTIFTIPCHWKLLRCKQQQTQWSSKDFESFHWAYMESVHIVIFGFAQIDRFSISPNS